MAGLFGHILAMGAIGYRIYDKSYTGTGRFATALQALPVVSSPKIDMLSIGKWTTLASLLSYVMVTHYNVSTLILCLYYIV